MAFPFWKGLSGRTAPPWRRSGANGKGQRRSFRAWVEGKAYPAGEGGVGLPLFREVLLEVEG
ncbi:hypothetical protein CSW26_00790 [Thermus scotoductus]|nr:hypothetical protein CSW26_00790 [Thermus scotoductus]